MLARSFRHRPLACVSSLLTVVALSHAAQGQEGLKNPVYRTTKNPDRIAARTTNEAPKTTFDLNPRPGEHPLMPALRLAQMGLEEIDTNVKDYSCTLIKRERIDGELGPYQFIYTKVRHQPFSVHMYFLKPYKGRECVYVEGDNLDAAGRSQLLARGAGWKARFGVVNLDPLGKLAMDGQKYPITKVGIRKLTEELVQVAQNDIKFGECKINTFPRARIKAGQQERETTMIEVVHPVPRKNFRFHRARIYIDNELRVPIRYASWLWPSRPGEKPLLEEEYTYQDLKINNGFTDWDFNQQNTEVFKK